MYSYGLEKHYRPDLYADFQEEVVNDAADNQLYGLEKFWAFRKFYRDSHILLVEPRLEGYLKKYRTLDDFKVPVSTMMNKRIYDTDSYITRNV